MTTLQVRIDAKTKRAAQKVLGDLGLDMSSAVRVYLKRIAITKSIPIPLMTGNGLTPSEELLILEASAEARRGKNITRPMTAKDALAYLKRL
ncbi:MAG: type II toxin-antitoxin system RelB/DinJ family antitoxin [Patescibacteria group bacterium]